MFFVESLFIFFFNCPFFVTYTLLFPKRIKILCAIHQIKNYAWVNIIINKLIKLKDSNNEILPYNSDTFKKTAQDIFNCI